MNREKLQKELSELETKAREIREELLKPEITPEERFLQLIEGSLQTFDYLKYPDELFVNKDDKWLLNYELKNKRVWVRWSEIWSVFEKEFSMNYDQIQRFTQDMVDKHFGWKGVTTREFLRE